MLFNTLAEHPSLAERTMTSYQLDTKRNEHTGSGNTFADGHGKLHLFLQHFDGHKRWIDGSQKRRIR
jgi:hypothetical protein